MVATLRVPCADAKSSDAGRIRARRPRVRTVRIRQSFRGFRAGFTTLHDVNVIWRTALAFLAARRRLRRGQGLAPTAVSSIRLTTLPTDIDILRHMNNGRYLSLFDLGRWDLLVRTGLYDAMKQRGWYAVVSNETVTFRKSLVLWQRFDVESRFIGHDEKALFMEHRAVVDGEVYARVVMRARMLRRSGGTVSHEEFFGALGRPEDVPGVEDWIHDWAAASALPSTKAPAPSVWHD
ncbi:MAG: thioesterase family protein [Actinobacteria bacterium]|nr:thioesterase family protein [Actinomycetota bacterium]